MSTDDPAPSHRRAVRQIASGVAVLTVRHGQAVHGTTVSSLTAVSREPLLVAACLHRRSSFTDLALAARRFSVNVLGSAQALVAGWFADPDRPAGAAQFDCVRWRPDPAGGGPLIDGSLASFSCALVDCVTAGDHRILLAEVTAGAAGEGSPLLHFSGRLHDGVLRGLPRGSGHPAVPATAMAGAPTAPLPS
ncbi:flavin reductase family protein [Micromonospora mirobrigensis]|uniref:NADH-FMN oxidoreductase RutF, flavin reductase (DIM6/NTAB) family n=1 Tax=Micromonospora mirobrigensis TaxID=262898 RepID=A0A1C4ZZ91_9ACTN|nr:flavin reductase family protein [Micromonospora mirobrigensis]SCF38318.1 NADH-FMN oxidoreductase RutF, flavin reductase (DIM6/NTAB) family [Micromonospora mirobrigensis]